MDEPSFVGMELVLVDIGLLTLVVLALLLSDLISEGFSSSLGFLRNFRDSGGDGGFRLKNGFHSYAIL